MKWQLGGRFALVISSKPSSLYVGVNHYNIIPCPWHRVLGRVALRIFRSPRATLLTLRLCRWNRTWEKHAGLWPTSLGNDEQIHKRAREHIERVQAKARSEGRPTIEVTTDWVAQCICKADPCDWAKMTKPPKKRWKRLFGPPEIIS